MGVQFAQRNTLLLDACRFQVRTVTVVIAVTLGVNDWRPWSTSARSRVSDARADPRAFRLLVVCRNAVSGVAICIIRAGIGTLAVDADLVTQTSFATP